MNVLLLSHTPNPEDVIATAARLCYSATDIETLFGQVDISWNEPFLKKIMSVGHYSVLEHASFTFGIEGISRVTTHQLVRHRLASYSQQSQRYVNSGSNPIILPPTIAASRDALEVFNSVIDVIRDGYDTLVALGIPAEDARYLLPNATETKIIMTMNARELLHFFKHRCCNRAQWEIRGMADKILELCYPIAPTIFETAGAACVSGPCPEGSMTCGSPRRVK